MRKLLQLLFVIAIVILLIPFAMGFWAKSQFHAAFDKLHLPQEVSLQVTHYDQGWFASKATIKMVISASHMGDILIKKRPNLAVQLHMPVKIVHGPILFESRLEPRLGYFLAYANAFVKTRNEAVQTAIKQFYEDQPQLLLSMLSTFDGNFFITSYSPRFDFSDNKQNLHWGGIRSYTQITNHGNKVASTIHLYPFFWSQEPMTLSFGGLTLHGRATRNKQGLWVGPTALQVKDITIHTPTGQLFNQDQLTFNTTLAQTKKNTLNTKVQLQVNRIDFADQHYGPVNIEYQLNGLYIPALIELNEFLDSISAKNQPQSKQLEVVDVQTLTNKIIPVINQGIELIIGPIKAIAPQGLLQVSGKAKLPPFNSANIIMAIPHIITKTSATADASLSVALAQTIIDMTPSISREMLDKLIEKNLIRQKDDQYTVHFEAENGIARINGMDMTRIDFNHIIQ